MIFAKNKSKGAKKPSKRVEKGQKVKKYVLRKDEVTDEDGSTHIGYGISVPSEDISIPDIFLDLSSAEDLIDRCNKYKLSTLHLYDVISDELV